MKRISILGSTGSIGVNTLDIVSQFPEKFCVTGLVAGQNVSRLAQQIQQFSPHIVSVGDERAAENLVSELKSRGTRLPEIVTGIEGAISVASTDDTDLVVTAMVGAIGLRPSLAAVDKGIEVAIANKEPLVAAGQLFSSRARRAGSTILPVDSEHNAIFQCLTGNDRQAVKRLVLTCSGGPFRKEMNLSTVTPEQALKHPTWSMGAKITIDSATLMNKGLEVIEARWLFDMSAKQIDVVIHPQSVIHSMVEYVDGSFIAQLGTPDMRVPIGYALGYPARLPLAIPKLDLLTLSTLNFEAPDLNRFRCLKLAYQALETGGTTPAVLNAANEVAVQAFLDRRIPFLAIPETIERTVEAHSRRPGEDLDEIIAADAWARDHAQPIIKELSQA